MIPIKQFLNKIKFSGKIKKDDIVIYYYDRIQNKLIPIPYKEIKIIDDMLLVDEKEIPLHRIKEIRNKNMIIWKRQWENIK